MRAKWGIPFIFLFAFIALYFDFLVQNGNGVIVAGFNVAFFLEIACVILTGFVIARNHVVTGGLLSVFLIGLFLAGVGDYFINGGTTYPPTCFEDIALWLAIEIVIITMIVAFGIGLFIGSRGISKYKRSEWL